jgi:hypothetical protein
MQTKGDFHVHTKYSKEPGLWGGILKTRAKYGPEELIQNVVKKGLGVIAITDHDTMDGANLGEKLVKKLGLKEKLVLMKGEEITSKGGHVIAVGIEECIPPKLSTEETVDRIHEQGGVAIAPHPFVPFGVGLKVFSVPFDGIEVRNSWAVALWGNKKAQAVLPSLNIAPIGSSDAHFLAMLGKVFTVLDLKSFSVDGVLKAIRDKQTEAVSLLRKFDNMYNFWNGFLLGMRIRRGL